ncbi:MAG: translation elongation factor Ts [Neomegalonema sp.]|nr:translation elongation factor Ts [Neomegalonema sp.]
MAEITAALVKELREKTGAGMMDSKKALAENGGDMEAAVDWLRAKGIAKAAKKASRVAAEGLVAVAVDGTVGAVVEVNSETDFVARNEDFQKMVGEIAQVALGVEGDTEALLAAKIPSSGKSVEEHVKDQVATIGENMSVRRFTRLSVDKGVVASYVHNAVAPGMGKIGVLVALQGDGDADAYEALGKQICMHIAATSPASLSEKDLDPALVEREKQVLTDQARESGKPDNVIEKMIVGRMNKFYQEVCLLKQAFVINPDLTVEKAIAEGAKGAELTAFSRLEVGEGIEKEESDFAAEVAAQAKRS